MKKNDLKIIFRGRGGITLIALVVTIIVLLILAGVTIMTLTGDNGIITRTSTAKKAVEEAEIKENIKLAYQNALLGQYAGSNETFEDVMQVDLEKVYGTGNVTVTKEGTDYIINITGRGKYIIDAYGNVSVISVVNVSEITNITPTNAIVTRGSSSQTIVATVNSGATELLTWTSDSEYVSISEPVVDSVNNTQTVTLTVGNEAPAGNVTITAQNKEGSLNANNTATITINVPATGITLRKTGEDTNLNSTDIVSIAKNSTQRFIAQVVPTGASNQNITWTIEGANPSGVITLPNPAASSSGNEIEVLAGQDKTGTATLKATVTGTEINATCKISVETVLTFTSVTAPNATNSTTCVGCYASIDGDNTPDGIIYADLGKGNQNTTGLRVSYSFAALTGDDATNLKSYVISNETVPGSMGERKLIKLAQNNTGTTKRFHIMGLENLKDSNKNEYLYWYYDAIDQENRVGKMTNYSSVTSDAFGAGKTNTETMTKNYTLRVGETYEYGEEEVEYGIVNSRDLWPNVPNGWYVPSKLEWVAFAGELGVTKDSGNLNYNSAFGLSVAYLSSSQRNATNIWFVDFVNWGMRYYIGPDSGAYVRLGTTF